MEWQPIDTAPRDGTQVDLWAGGHRHTDYSWDEKAWRGEGAWRHGSAVIQKSRVTYWMPLPDPPREEDVDLCAACGHDRYMHDGACFVGIAGAQTACKCAEFVERSR